MMKHVHMAQLMMFTFMSEWYLIKPTNLEVSFIISANYQMTIFFVKVCGSNKIKIIKGSSHSKLHTRMISGKEIDLLLMFAKIVERRNLNV